jgi:hypothetical protein
VADEHRERFATAIPFPHVVFDDLAPGTVLDAVLAEFPGPDEVEWWRFDSPQERKLGSLDERIFGTCTRHLTRELNAAPFVTFLERLTGIEGLVPDPHLWGGGLHQVEPGGYLEVHADFNRHPKLGLYRRLNLLVYMNHGWQESWGGQLELWEPTLDRCVAHVLPVWNRWVVFATSSTSFHGHPQPVRCPPGLTRKSLALYYYTVDPPPGDGREVRSTRFRGQERGQPAGWVRRWRRSSSSAIRKSASRSATP